MKYILLLVAVASAVKLDKKSSAYPDTDSVYDTFDTQAAHKAEYEKNWQASAATQHDGTMGQANKLLSN